MNPVPILNIAYDDEQITWFRGRTMTTCFFMTQTIGVYYRSGMNDWYSYTAWR